MKHAALLVACLAVAGCSSRPWKLTDEGQQRYTSKDLVRISLGPLDSNRIDTYVNVVGYKHTIATGEVWRRIFIGKDGDPRFKVTSALLRQSYGAGGFAARFTYTITGDCQGTEVRAVGSRAAAIAIQPAIREAVELGVVDAAAQCNRIISGS